MRSLTSLQDMPVTYIGVRASTWDKLQAACAELQPSSPGLAHTAMFWLDQAVAAGLLPLPVAGSTNSGSALQPSWLAAAVMAAAQDVHSISTGSAAPAGVLTESAVAARFEVTTDALQGALAALQGACGVACIAPVTAHAMLELYVQVLSSGRMHYQVGLGCCVACRAAMLVTNASSHCNAWQHMHYALVCYACFHSITCWHACYVTLTSSLRLLLLLLLSMCAGVCAESGGPGPVPGVRCCAPASEHGPAPQPCCSCATDCRAQGSWAVPLLAQVPHGHDWAPEPACIGSSRAAGVRAGPQG